MSSNQNVLSKDNLMALTKTSMHGHLMSCPLTRSNSYNKNELGGGGAKTYLLNIHMIKHHVTVYICDPK